LQVLVTGTGAAPFRPAAEGILFIFVTWPSFQEAESAGAFPLPGKADGASQSCEGGVRLLKFHVCWDAAVCAVSADGFFNV
jgi:hypothetical protein